MTSDDKALGRFSVTPRTVEKNFSPRTDPSDGQANAQPRVAPQETDSLPEPPPASDD
jgi:hypothetical protein